MASLNALAQTCLPLSVYRRLAGSDIGRRLAHGSFWSLINALVMKSAALVQAIILARILGIAGFGEWGILLSTIAMAGVFATAGLAVTTTKHVAQWRAIGPEKLGRLLGLLQLMGLGSGLAMLFLFIFGANPIADWLLSAPQLSSPLAIVGVIVFFNTISSIYTGVLQGLERFRDVALIEGLCSLFGVIVSLALALIYGVFGALGGLAFGSLLKAVASGFRSHTVLESESITVTYRQAFNEWFGIKHFAIPNALASSITLASLWIAQVFLVRQSSGFDAMGAYQAANQWRTLVIYLPTVMLSALLPIFASLSHSNYDKLLWLERQAMFRIMSLTAIISVPFLFLAPSLMGLYGDHFEPYYFVLILLVVQPIFDIGYAVLQRSANACGQVWLLVPANLAMALVIFALAPWLIREHLALGLAVALLVGHLARWLSLWLLLLRARKEAKAL